MEPSIPACCHPVFKAACLFRGRQGTRAAHPEGRTCRGEDVAPSTAVLAPAILAALAARPPTAAAAGLFAPLRSAEDASAACSSSPDGGAGAGALSSGSSAADSAVRIRASSSGVSSKCRAPAALPLLAPLSQRLRTKHNISWGCSLGSRIWGGDAEGGGGTHAVLLPRELIEIPPPRRWGPGCGPSSCGSPTSNLGWCAGSTSAVLGGRRCRFFK